MRHLRQLRRPEQLLIEFFHPRLLLGRDCFQVAYRKSYLQPAH